jgi:hypothetical protein
VKITVDIPDDVVGLPCELWLTLRETGYEPHVVAFYESDAAQTVFDAWWAQRHRDAQKAPQTRKRKHA